MGRGSPSQVPRSPSTSTAKAELPYGLRRCTDSSAAPQHRGPSKAASLLRTRDAQTSELCRGPAFPEGEIRARQERLFLINSTWQEFRQEMDTVRTALAEPGGTGRDVTPRTGPPSPSWSSRPDGRKKKTRISDEHHASPGKLNKGFVRKRCFQRLAT